MFIDHRLEFVYVSTRKCATNTMYEMLKKYYNGTIVGGIHNRVQSDIPKGYFIFTVCRNPYSRAVSLWWSTCMRGEDDRYKFREACGDYKNFECFMKWLVEIAKNPKAQGLVMNQTMWHNGIIFDTYIRIEDLKEEFMGLPFVSKWSTIFPRLNTTFDHRESYQSYITPKAGEFVREWAGEDFVKFGYSMELPL